MYKGGIEKKNKLKIGVYCRVSSLKQKENTSLNNQMENGIGFCKRNNFDYEIFSETISGGKGFDDREMFNDLSGKLLNKELDGIWFNYWDRGWREDSIKFLFIQLVKDSNCKVFVGNEEKNILSDEGSFELGFFSLMSDYERKKIVSRFKNGKKRRLENDEIFVGVKGIGYKRVNKRIEVDEKESIIVRECFEKYLNKSVKTFRDCVNLMKRKYGNNLDLRINEKSLSRIFKDEKYKGISVHKFDNEEYKLNVGRIVTDELFDKVNLKLNKNKGRYRGNKKNLYSLDGKVYCSCCNNVMWIIGGNGYNYFRCSEKINENRKKWDNRFDFISNCNSIKDNKISLNKLEDIIWDILFIILRNSESVKNEYLKKYKKEDINKNEFKGKLKFYEKKIETEENKKYSVLDKLVSGEITKEEKDIFINGLNVNISKLKKEYKEIKEEFNRIENNDVVVDYVERFLNYLDKKYKIERIKDKKRFIEKYINKIEVLRKEKNKNNRLEYELKIKFNLVDKEINLNNEIIDNKMFNDFKIYISNLNNMEIWRL